MSSPLRILALGICLGTAALMGCTPEVVNEAYFCGPERLCPPEQACDESSATCTRPEYAQPFACPLDSEMFEPDNVLSQARNIGGLACGIPPLDFELGCLDGVNDVDLLSLQVDADCVGNDPHLEIQITYPIALVPATLELLDEQERVIETGSLCTPEPNFTGTNKLCISTWPPSGRYFLRVRSDRDSALDCDGDCHFNHYTLSIDFPLN